MKNRCSLGGDTENKIEDMIIAGNCTCDLSCEPHTHIDYPYANAVLCFHDGETDHGHCPQNPWNNEIPPYQAARL